MGSDGATALFITKGGTTLRDTSVTTINVSNVAKFTAIVTPDAVKGTLFMSSTNDKAWIYDGSAWKALW
jgi:hypothetical protein